MSGLEFSAPKPEVAIRHKAMDLLARREHSRLELYRKLVQRFPDDSELLNPVLDRLAEENLQSDQRFAESYLESGAGKGYGPLRISAELQKRGIASSIIDQSFQNCAVNWQLLAYNVLRKKYSDQAESFAERAKRSRFLQYRGFELEQIKQALAQYSDLHKEQPPQAML